MSTRKTTHCEWFFSIIIVINNMSDDNITIKNRIRECYDINGNLSFSKISKDLLSIIEKNTEFLDEYGPTTSERVYCILNDIKKIITCPMTGVKLKFSPQTKNYKNTVKFSQANKKILNKPDIKGRHKRKIKIIEDKYHNKNFDMLSIENCIKKFESIYTNDKVAVTVDMGYKYIDFSCSVIYHTKFLSERFSDMSERYYLMKHGLKEIPKDRNGNVLKYINRYEGYSKYADRKNRLYEIREDIEQIITQDYHLNFYIKDGGTTNRMNLTCKKCSHTFETFFKNSLWRNIYCAGCYGDPQRSKAEFVIVDFLKEIGVDNIIENDKTILDGLELDIYCPNQKIAIEYCGIVWHSFGTNHPNNQHKESDNKNKHYLKYKKCKDLGIRLITIFDNEWNKKQDIVKSMLINVFNKNSSKIYARKCEYGAVDKDVAKRFLVENHIQGECRFSKAYGLFHAGELVSLACFGKRKITRGEVRNELLRFCSKMGTNVVGGASKIIKNSGENNFISYCDVRYGSGNLYEVLGMKLLRHSKPNYYYTLNKTDLIHRSNFQKHKITHRGDPKTEREIMYERGYRRIYDCGNLVFEYKK